MENEKCKTISRSDTDIYINRFLYFPFSIFHFPFSIKYMPTTSIVSGVLLILIGIIGYVFGSADGHASPTALIPAAFGLLLVIFGALAKSKENLRKHLMHAAVLIGFLGFLATASSILKIPSLLAGTAERPAAVAAQFAMALICFVFVILCVNSFIAARRNG
jgi:fluoride ion exporter CrcB/FEX